MPKTDWTVILLFVPPTQLERITRPSFYWLRWRSQELFAQAVLKPLSSQSLPPEQLGLQL
jgi:hypothetical protein